jgi:hypothetical protein
MSGLLIPSPPHAVKEVKMSRRAKTLIAAIVIVFFWLPFYALFIMGLARPGMWRCCSTPWLEPCGSFRSVFRCPG